MNRIYKASQQWQSLYHLDILKWVAVTQWKYDTVIDPYYRPLKKMIYKIKSSTMEHPLPSADHIDKIWCDVLLNELHPLRKQYYSEQRFKPWKESSITVTDFIIDAESSPAMITITPRPRRRRCRDLTYVKDAPKIWEHNFIGHIITDYIDEQGYQGGVVVQCLTITY
jgi:hypothetical protein